MNYRSRPRLRRPKASDKNKSVEQTLKELKKAAVHAGQVVKEV